MIEIKKNDDLITRRIKQAMNEKGFEDQKSFCESFDPKLPQPLLTEIFKGTRRTIDNLLMIADKLECSLDYLVGKTDIQSVDPNLQMIGDVLHLSQKSIESIQLIHVFSVLNDGGRNPLEYLLSSPDVSRIALLFREIMYYFKNVDDSKIGNIEDYDIGEQVLLWNISQLLIDIRKNSEGYINALQKKIEQYENNKSRTEFEDSLMKLYKYKLESIVEERKAQKLYRKEKIQNNNGKE